MRLNTASNEGRLPVERWATAARGRPRVALGVRWAVVMPVALYALAAGLLLYHIGSHPAFAYNWEEYTAWHLLPFFDHPNLAIFTPTEGLMTDSGLSPLVVLPAWVVFALAGPGVTALRVATALVAALAVPLLWWVGRRLLDHQAALLAAALLALNPSFLLYGRTGTSVGLSLVPALLTIGALLRLLEEPRDWRRLAIFQALLLLDTYAYAPIRFLWPLCLFLLAIEWMRRPRSTRPPRLAFAVLLLVLPAVLTLADPSAGHNPILAVANYYDGHGEEVAGFIYNQTPAAQIGQHIAGNAGDYVNLLLNRDTLPTITDYWRPAGQLYAGLLVPFFLLGFALTLKGLRTRREDRVLAVLFLGFGLPLLLTSQVHVGRLIYTLPLLMLLVARAFVATVDWFMAIPGGRRIFPLSIGFKRRIQQGALPALALLLLAGIAWTTWNDYRIDPPAPPQVENTDALRDHPPAQIGQSTAGALVTSDADPDRLAFEAIHAQGMRLELDRQYRFVDLGDPASAPPLPDDTRTLVYYGDLLDRLARPGGVPNLCRNAYYVAPDYLARFLAIRAQLVGVCNGGLSYTVLPH